MARDEINAFLGVGTTYQGKLQFQGAVRIDGKFQGEVDSQGTLIVGQEAVVEGEVRVDQLVLSGKLVGEVEVKDKAVLHKTANLQGNIRTPVLVVEEGAVVDGQIFMTTSTDASEVSVEDSEK